MRTFRVKVNGKEYEVEIEEIGNFSDAAHITPFTPPKPKSTQTTSAPAARPIESVQAPGSGEIVAPMPGTILSINCQNGQSVKKGDVLLVLEAMKMENEIQAPCDASVADIKVSKGQSVDAGVLLVQLSV